MWYLSAFVTLLFFKLKLSQTRARCDQIPNKENMIELIERWQIALVQFLTSLMNIYSRQ